MIFGFSSIHASTFNEAIHEHQTFKVTPSKPNLKELHQASTLVISCVDFRLRDETERLFREHLSLLDDYDEVSLPGASLAFVDANHQEWGKTISDTIGLLKNLHNINQVVFLDHMGCGAYKYIKGEQAVNLPEKEKKEHLASFQEAREKMTRDFPELKVYTLIMELDGTVTRYD